MSSNQPADNAVDHNNQMSRTGLFAVLDLRHASVESGTVDDGMEAD